MNVALVVPTTRLRWYLRQWFDTMELFQGADFDRFDSKVDPQPDPGRYDYVVRWGRTGHNFLSGTKATIILEAGFYEWWPDVPRKHLFCISIGQHGGNGHFYEPTWVDAARPELELLPLRARQPDKPVMILGQMPKDKFIRKDYLGWVKERIAEFGPDTIYRIHPNTRPQWRQPVMSVLGTDTVFQNVEQNTDLFEACEDIDFAISWNSTAAIKLAAWGVPQVCYDSSSMAWPMAPCDYAHSPPAAEHRVHWMRKLSYRNWRPEEMTPDRCGEYLRRALGY